MRLIVNNLEKGSLVKSKELVTMPDHSNELTRDTEERIGQFIFHENQSEEVEFFKGKL